MSQLNRINLLLVFVIIAIAKFVEDIYSPLTLEIVNDLGMLKSNMQHASSMYFSGFVVGVMIFGQLSDIIGRKRCVLICFLLIVLGISIFSNSHTIDTFYLGKFIQGAGSSMSSVLSQAICRDVYEGKELSKVYGHAYYFSFFTKFMGILLGNYLAIQTNWRLGYYVVAPILIALLLLNIFFLKETNPSTQSQLFSKSFFKTLRTNFELFILIFRSMIFDLNILLRAIIIGLSASIVFGIFYEAPFFYMGVLKLSSEAYSLVYLSFGIGMFLVGTLNNFLIKRIETRRIVELTSFASGVLSFIFLGLIMVFQNFKSVYLNTISITIISAILQILIICLSFTTSNNILTSSFKNKTNIGISSSIFISMYYSIITLMIFLIGSYSQLNLFSMPIILIILSSSVFLLTYLGFTFKKILKT